MFFDGKEEWKKCKYKWVESNDIRERNKNVGIVYTYDVEEQSPYILLVAM